MMPVKVAGLCPLLQVFDMPISIAFYCGVVGFEIAMQSRPGDQFDWALLRMGATELMLNTAYEADARPAARDAARQGAHGDTGLYFHCADLNEAYEYLKSHGVAAEKPVVRVYGMKQLNFRDPDGYELCFQHEVK
jgi:catechol 2,3-dioxygenase-like lactoylglutathione lyase family enzyme